MTVHSISTITLPKLESSNYALKRRADLLSIIVDYKLDSRIPEKWRDIYIVIYNCLSKIESLPYLISERDFPQSHYSISTLKRIDFKFIGRKFNEIVAQKNELYSNAYEFKKLLEDDVSLVSFLRPEISWSDWLDVLDEINYYVDDTNEIF